MSINIDGMSAYGLGNYNTSSITSKKTQDLKNSLDNINSASDEELMEVCKEFETYMLEQVIKSMESTIGKEEEDSTSYMSMFGDNLTNSYAKAILDQGEIGLAQMLYESMKRN